MIKKIFFSGIRAFIPIALTVAIVIWLFATLETFFGRVLKYYLPDQYYFPGLGILLAIALIFILGIIVNLWMVNKVYKLAERIVKKIPIINVIYNAIQDFMAYFDREKQNEQQTVIIDTPVGKLIGLITCDKLENLKLGINTEDKVMVYLPFSYTIGGITVMVAKKDVKPLNMTVDKAMTFLLTAGMVGNK